MGAQASPMPPALGKGTEIAAMMGNTERIYGFLPCGPGKDALQLIFAEDRIASILWSPCGDGSGTSALGFAREFLPADAAASGSVSRSGFDSVSVYHSQALGRQLDDRWFEDCSGNNVSPGTLVVASIPDGGWDLTAGTCPSSGQ